MPKSRFRIGRRFALPALMLLLGGNVCTGQTSPAQPPANQGSGAQEPPNQGPPAVNPGRPTVTDPAALTAPGWLETEFGLQKDLDRDRNFMTPLLLKLTDRNARLEYRLAYDGYQSFAEEATDGFGNVSVALQYLFAPQSRAGFDVSGRLQATIPTASAGMSTNKFDFSAMLLASRDFSPWAHGDFNASVSSLSRLDAPGTDTQLLLSASFTFPFKGNRWAYTNELVYLSPISGQRAQVTTMHGFTYAVHRYEVYDIALQWELEGDGAVFQILGGCTFFLGKLF
jgi:hypothetical protein